MIKGISNGPGIIVNGGNTSLPWIASNDSNSFQGSLRLRGNDIQYYDNGVWNTLSTSYATVNLDASTIEIIEWARKKKLEEEVLLSLPDDNPAVKIARENVNRAKQALKDAEEQLKVTSILSEEQ